MTNDPDDRFMISDLSSKLSAYINGEDNAAFSLNTDSSNNQVGAGELPQRETRNAGRGLAGRNSSLGRGNAGSPPVSQLPRSDRNIEEALASEIKPTDTVKRTPADSMFSDLDHALDSHEDEVRSRQIRNQQLREQQLRQKQLQKEQLRQKQLQEEQLRQRQLQEEQLRQRQLQEEQLRQRQLQEQQAAAKIFSKSLYSFDPNASYLSLYSGHMMKLSEMPVQRKEVPQRIVDAASAMSAATSTTERRSSYPNDGAGTAAADTGNMETSQRPADNISPESSSEVFAGSTFDPYEGHPDDTDDSRRSGRRGGGKAGFIIALISAILVGVVLFLLIRSYSSKIMGLVTGSPSSGTASVAESTTGSDADESTKADDTSKADADTAQGVNGQEEGAQAEGTDEAIVDNTDTTLSDAGNDGETESIENADTGSQDATVIGEVSPEDPNYIAYLSSVNEKASTDAIAELSPEAPRLYLSAYAVKINAGARFNALSFVESIEDDRDDRTRLYGDISVDGLREFDASVPGTYELIFYCYDSSANRSNKAKMTVIVD